MADASIHFQLAKSGSFSHMMREQNRKSASYLLKNPKLENEYWTRSEDGRDVAQELFDHEYSKLTGRGKRPKFENCLREAVINLNSKHGLEDVKAVCKKLEDKYGLICTAIAIHRDEGHRENNTDVYNLHAHAVFMTFTQTRDEKKPSEKWRKVTNHDLAAMQDLVADTLGMKRGERNSERKHLDHSEYREYKRLVDEQIKELKHDHKKELKELEDRLETEQAERGRIEKELADLKSRQAVEVKEHKTNVAEQVSKSAAEETDWDKNLDDLVQLRNPLKLAPVEALPPQPMDYSEQYSPVVVTPLLLKRAYEASTHWGLSMDWRKGAEVANQLLESQNSANEETLRKSAAQTKEIYDHANRLHKAYDALTNRLVTLCEAIADKSTKYARSICLGVVHYYNKITKGEQKLLEQRRERLRETGILQQAQKLQRNSQASAVMEQRLGLKQQQRPLQRTQNYDHDYGMDR